MTVTQRRTEITVERNRADLIAPGIKSTGYTAPKQATFDLTGLTAARTYTMPDMSGTLMFSPETTVTLEELGMTEGASNGAPYLQAALDLLATETSLQIILPDYDVTLLAACTRTLTAGQRVEIVGTAASRLIVDNTTGGIILTAASAVRNAIVGFRGFKVLSKRVNAGIALKYAVDPGGSQRERIAYAIDLAIQPYNFASGDYAFNEYLVLTGMYRPYVFNVNCGSSNVCTHVGDCAIRVDDTYKAHVENCYWIGNIDTAGVFSAGIDVGISDVGTDGEGGFFFNNTVNGATKGIVRTRTSREPELWICNNHLNCYTTAIEINGARLFYIDRNLLYTSQDGAASPYRDIHVTDAEDGMITNNEHHQSYNTSRVLVDLAPGVGKNVENLMVKFGPVTASCTSMLDVQDGALAISATIPEFKASGPTITNMYRVYSADPVADEISIWRAQTGNAYPERTWSSTLAFGGNSTGILPATQTGTYRIVQGVMHGRIPVTLTNKGVQTGVATFTLPSGLVEDLVIVAGQGNGVLKAVANMSGLSSPIAYPHTAGLLRIQNQGATGTTDLTNTAFTDTTTFILEFALPLEVA